MYEYRIVADLHSHTVASDHAFSTITENARHAFVMGLKAVGCTDHGPAVPDAPYPWHFSCLFHIPDMLEGVRLFRGIEVNVTDRQGTLDMNNELLSRLDVVIASMHGGVMSGNSVEECTSAWMHVAENPAVDIIGHCGSPEFVFDYEPVIKEFGRCGKAVEINDNSFVSRESAIPNCIEIAKLCMKHEVQVVVNSDAHFHLNVGNVSRSLALLGEINFPPRLIVNASVEGMNNFFARKNIVL